MCGVALMQNPAAFVEIGYILVFSDVLQSMLLPHAAQCAQSAHCLLAGGALFGGFRRFGLGLFRHGGRFFFGFRLLRLFPRGKRHGRGVQLVLFLKAGHYRGHRRGGRRGIVRARGIRRAHNGRREDGPRHFSQRRTGLVVGVPGGMVRLILGLFRFGCFFCLRLFFCFSLRRCVFRRFFLRVRPPPRQQRPGRAVHPPRGPPFRGLNPAQLPA